MLDRWGGSEEEEEEVPEIDLSVIIGAAEVQRVDLRYLSRGEKVALW